MTGRFGKVQYALFAGWGLAFAATAWFTQGHPDPPLDPGAKERPELRVYSNTAFYRKLEKPAEFGLDKLTAVVNYLLLATAAVLAFLTKSVMDLRAEAAAGAAGGRPTRGQYLLLLHAGIACLYSLAGGVMAYLTLPDIAVVETFAVTGSLSRCVVAQLAGLVAAVVLLLLGLAGMVRGLLP